MAVRIAFLGHFRERGATGDMGTRAVGHHLIREAARHHEVLRVDIRDTGAWHQLAAFRPEIVHLVLGPTTRGLIASWLCMIPLRSARRVISAPNPSPHLLRAAVRLCRPDLVLVQSGRSERFFSSAGLRTGFLPNGVDLERFAPASPDARRALRAGSGLDPEKFTVLHVGPVIPGRNLLPLATLPGQGYQVVVIGRDPVDRPVHRHLTESGCTVITGRDDSIERWYQLADCYVFLVPPEETSRSIETPLSVLEAMATNLPVITTRFGALPRLFPESGDGLEYLEHPDRMEESLSALQVSRDPVHTRDRVAPWAWPRIGARLMEYYTGLQANPRTQENI
jgi:glycosyltransferase involved in cell wall biosynthesis